MEWIFGDYIGEFLKWWNNWNDELSLVLFFLRCGAMNGFVEYFANKNTSWSKQLDEAKERFYFIEKVSQSWYGGFHGAPADFHHDDHGGGSCAVAQLRQRLLLQPEDEPFEEDEEGQQWEELCACVGGSVLALARKKRKKKPTESASAVSWLRFLFHFFRSFFSLSFNDDEHHGWSLIKSQSSSTPTRTKAAMMAAVSARQ